jgi:hypothetical protein
MFGYVSLTFYYSNSSKLSNIHVGKLPRKLPKYTLYTWVVCLHVLIAGIEVETTAQ